jgi:hypothetical protein
MQRRNPNKVDSLSQFICPTNGYRGTQIRNGIQPKNHMRDNIRELREAQILMREKKEEEARPAKSLSKLSQFQNVQSRVYETSGKYTERRGDGEGKEFLPRGVAEERRSRLAEENRFQRCEVEKKIEEARHYSSAQQLTPRKSSLPREYGALAGPTTVDYVMRNKVEAMQLLPDVACSEMGEASQYHRPTVHEDFGRVPEYLEERKARWAAEEEEQRRRRPDPNCPPGMCLMPESERCDTLDTLQGSKNEALHQLRRMPFVVETPTMKKKQEFLENKLREIDNAIAIFSKDKVYVALGR